MTKPLSTRIRWLHGRILGQLDDFLALAGDAAELERRVPRISAWNVAQQLEHLTLSDHRILDRFGEVERGEIASVGGGPNAFGRILLTLGWIPRGKGRAPEMMRPGEVDAESLRSALREVRQGFEKLGDDLGRFETAGWTLTHAVFGNLSPALWLRFVGIHHHHHWKIIRDIRKASCRGARPCAPATPGGPRRRAG